MQSNQSCTQVGRPISACIDTNSKAFNHDRTQDFSIFYLLFITCETLWPESRIAILRSN